MFPILVDIKARKIVLAGEGDALEKRLALLDETRPDALTVVAAAPSAALRARAGDRLLDRAAVAADFEGAALVFLAGLPDAVSEPLAAAARAAGALVNCEDRPAWCDFHVPAMVRRGDLILTVSTGGRSPGLARWIRRRLEGLFGPDWAERLDHAAERRTCWRAEGLPLDELGRRTEDLIRQQGWQPRKEGLIP